MIESIRQAYCIGLRADDRRAFVTVDSILTQRDLRSSTAIQARLVSNAADLTRLREENRQLTENCAALSAQISASVRHDQQAEIAEYESLLSETMAEADQLKRGVASLSERLYANMGKEFSPDDSESNPQLCELQHAIYSCFARLSNRK